MARLKLIDTMMQATIGVAIICLIGGSLTHYVREGISLFAGALWGSVNFYLLKHLMQNLLLHKEKKYLKLIILFSIKWPLLYLAGYGLLKTGYFSSAYLLIGFSIILCMIFIFGMKKVLSTGVNEK